ncbi:hypothetical protein, partial [Paraburkholderia fungorum]|uniref:hypothetical protein n=1 Tax=Paraburkholderia fungorum TaxID=134537 RepID=UPI001AC00416
LACASLTAVPAIGHPPASSRLTSNTVAFLCGRQRKVGAAPHRGNANRPIRKQGKAKRPTTSQKTNNRPDHDHSKKKPKEPDQEKANAAGKKNQPTPRPRLKKSLP